MGNGTLASIGTGVRLRAARLSAVLALALAAAVVATLALGAAVASAQEDEGRVLIYTGTTGYRHADAINNGRPVVQSALEDAGYTVDWEDCDNNGGGANNCDNANKNPRIFTDENLARYDAILLFNASASWAGGGRPGPLWDENQRAAIIRFVQGGGGIAANHNATDMGAGVVSWDWWDNGPNSAVGSLMKGHAASSQSNVADVQVADRNHLSTRDLPDTYRFGDEHYNFARSVRGTHHVLETLDERTYNPGNPMGQDHPITWCKLYDGDNVNDGTATPKPYNDGRVWVSGMGHFGSSYTANGGDNELVKQIVGGVRWVAGEGKKSDCSGTVWSSFKRTILVDNVNGPIGVDVAKDGKVYWTEIGPNPGFTSEGYLKMYDPTGPANNKTTVITIPTRADHGNSEDGVLGMSLEPGFDLSDPDKRDVFIYYSPRNPAWPTSGDQTVVGYNQISRFTLGPEGTAVVPGSERVILRVPKAKISGNPSGFPGGPRDSGPGHVGGAGLDFDSEGNLYLGVGDDVSPNASGHAALTPMDYRAAERWDARKTAANSADLRGKVLRIHPKDDIASGAEPGVDTTYTVPAGNMFAPGTPKTRPEIYAMGFRQPFTVHTDAKNPGNVVVGEYCHDASSNVPNRAPAGVCEWNLVDEPGFNGWPLCMGDNSPDNSSTRWDYTNNTSTNQKYDCNQAEIPSDIRWAPDGQTSAAPTFDGLDTLPGPAKKATIWKKDAAPGNHPVADFGNLSAGGRSPVTGPVYRYNAETAGPGAFPPYYDGSWFITNRGDNSGFWKEVRLREDDGKMLRVNDWAPSNQFGTPSNSFVIPTQFGPDGALYMARWNEGCCRSALNAGTQTQLVKIEFAVQDECLSDELPPNTNHSVAGRVHPDEPGTYLDEATLTVTAGDAGCAGVDTIEYRVNSDAEGDWEAYSGPVTFDEPGTYSVEYRATDRMDNTSAVKEASFAVVHIDDDGAPEVTGTLSGAQNEQGYYTAPATLTVEATDKFSPIDSIEYRVNQAEEWTTTDVNSEELTAEIQKQFSDSGFQFVEFRATDTEGNVSEIQSVRFSVIGSCQYARSDEFEGSALDGRWLRHTRNGGTPTSGPLAPTVADGQLSLPTNNFEIDAASPDTALGPINFVAQDLPQLGSAWEVETQLTVTHTGGWQGVGLMVWQADNNFFRSTITHSLQNGTIYVEQSKDNPTTAEGSRAQAGGNVTILPAKGPVTIRMRYARAEGANTVSAQYRVIAPASAANPDWVNFPSASGNGFLDLNPASGSRRDSAGSRVGIYAGGNFPGTTGNNPYPGTPASVKVDYFRVTPDQVQSCPDDDVEPPVTTAALDPSDPGPGGTYSGPVDVNLSATDGDDENASGVGSTEYRVDGGDWQESENGAGADPFTTSVAVSGAGEHTVEYRSRDEAGNLEVSEEVSFTIEPGGGGDDTTAPVTTATLDPSAPGAGGTYDGPVDVTLSATDPEEGGEDPEPQTHNVSAMGAVWSPTEVEAVTGDVVTWHFDEQDAVFPHDVWVVPPGGNPDPAGPDIYQVTNGIVMPGGAPVSETLDEEGTWTYLCKLHSGYSGGEWAGMTGTIDVTEAGDTGPGASGVDFTEYRVNTDGATGAWVKSDNDGGEDPFATSFTVSAPGSHIVEYRSTDAAGNAETTKSVAFSVEDDGGEEGVPTVEAFADPASGPAPLRVRFSATGIDPDGGSLSYRWEFENGEVLGPNARYTFTEPGTHTAKVTVTDDEGDTASDTVEVTVTDPGTDNKPPTVEASVDEASGPAPHRVRFDATGNDPDGRNADLVYHWEFGDGGESLAHRPAHTYREPGTYTAKVTVTDPHEATATAEVEVEVTNPPGNRPPVVEAAAAPSSGTAPLSTLLSALGTDPDGDKLTYRWEFGDGQSAAGRAVRHVYLLGGTYTAKVTATDEAGATATAEVDIVVGNPAGNQAPTVRAAADPTSGTAPRQVRFSAAGSDPDGDALMYVWEFGDGGKAGGPSATHTYTAPGTYTAKVTVTDPRGAKGSATVTVTVTAAAAPRPSGNVAGDHADRSAFGKLGVPKSMTAFRRNGVRVTVSCASGARGKATLQIARTTAKRLKLKSRTVASRTVRCADGRKVTLRLKPSRLAAKRLAARKTRRLKVTLSVKLKGERSIQRSLTIRPRN
jgi:PKD repeat protein/plastocyanin